jgi:hypothetical protein
MHRRSVREAIRTRRAQFPRRKVSPTYQCDNVRGFQTAAHRFKTTSEPPGSARWRTCTAFVSERSSLHDSRLRQHGRTRASERLIRWRRTGPRLLAGLGCGADRLGTIFRLSCCALHADGGGQLHEINQCARNLVVRFATLHRSSIRRGKRIAWCAMAAGRFSQHAANSVSFLQNALTSRPADASGALYLESNLARPNAALFPHRSRRMIRIRRISRVCRRPAPSDSGKQDFHKPSNRAR